MYYFESNSVSVVHWLLNCPKELRSSIVILLILQNVLLLNKNFFSYIYALSYTVARQNQKLYLGTSLTNLIFKQIDQPINLAPVWWHQSIHSSKQAQLPLLDA